VSSRPTRRGRSPLVTAAGFGAQPRGRAVFCASTLPEIAGRPSGDAAPAASRNVPKVSFHPDAKSAEKAAKRSAKRDRMWWLLAGLRAIQPYEQLKKCCRVRVRRADGVECHVVDHGGERRAHLGGLARCNSAWACPACAPKIRAEYAERIDAAVKHFGRPATRLVTFTVRHSREDSLAVLIKKVRKAMQRLQGGRWWEELKAALGLHTVASMEITHGLNGWHVHFHAAWFLEHPEQLDPATILGLQARWRRMVRKHMGEAHVPDQLRGFQVDECRPGMGHYMLGAEISDAGEKKGRRGHRTVWQIAAAYAQNKRERDAALWQEYVRATHGKTIVKGSRGLWALVGVSEEEPTADDDATEDSHVGTIDDQLWKAVRDDARKPRQIERALERDGMAAVLPLFEQWGFKVRLTDLGGAGPPVLHMRR